MVPSCRIASSIRRPHLNKNTHNNQQIAYTPQHKLSPCPIAVRSQARTNPPIVRPCPRGKKKKGSVIRPCTSLAQSYEYLIRMIEPSIPENLYIWQNSVNREFHTETLSAWKEKHRSTGCSSLLLHSCVRANRGMYLVCAIAALTAYRLDVCPSFKWELRTDN